MKISYSQVKTYRACPLQYRYASVDRIRVPPTAEMVFGGQIHNMLKRLHNPGQETTPDREAFLNWWRWGWSGMGYPDEPTAREFFGQGVELLAAYYDANMPLVGREVVAVEKRFAAPLGEHELTGRYDRLDRLDDGSYEVIDYKTNRTLPEEDPSSESLQLSVYHIGAAPRVEVGAPVRVRFYYVRHDRGYVSSRSPEEVEQARSIILDTAEAIQSERFDPAVGPHCERCPYRIRCPEWRQGETRDQRPKTRDQRSETRDQRPEIGDLRSEI